MSDVEVLADLDVSRSAEVRTLLTDAFAGRFTDHDWEHCLGGWHVLVSEPGALVAHAAVVPRVLEFGGQRLLAGYVEGVATRRERQRSGYGTAAMHEISRLLRAHFDVGALSTSSPEFYERLGWDRWRGRSFVRAGTAMTRTPEEDNGIMVLRYGESVDMELTRDIVCDSRAGDDW